MIKKWKESSLLDKVIFIIHIVSSAAVIVFAILMMLEVWDKAINACLPSMAVMCACQGYVQYKSSRAVAYLNFGVAVFIFICAIVVFFVK